MIKFATHKFYTNWIFIIDTDKIDKECIQYVNDNNGVYGKVVYTTNSLFISNIVYLHYADWEIRNFKQKDVEEYFIDLL